MKKILITGANGFIGQHLVSMLESRTDIEIVISTFDLTCPVEITDFFKGRLFDTVIHLAGLSSPPLCEHDPSKTFQINTIGATLVAWELGKTSPGATFVFPSTAHVYATQEQSGKEANIIEEGSQIGPINTYGKSKWMAEVLLKDIAERSKLNVRILRLFNHTHMSQSEDFFLPSVYKQILELKKTGKRKIFVGNVDICRDIGAVQDLVSALEVFTNLNLGTIKFDVFNVCSGTSKNLSKIILKMASKLGIENLEIIVDSSKVREKEAKFILGSCKKITKGSNWIPKATDEDALIEMFLSKGMI